MVSYYLILQIFWWAVLCGSVKQNIDELMSSPKQLPKDLNCHICHSDKDGDECKNFTGKSDDEIAPFNKTCDVNSTMCMVRRFSFKDADGMTDFAWKRNCSSNCEPGCVIMGERTRLYVCNSCCQTSLCNVGNSAESFSFKLSWILRTHHFTFITSLFFFYNWWN